jgi:hypothetical protein
MNLRWDELAVGAKVSHRSAATVALNEVKTQAVNGLSTMMSCETITSVSTWHGYKGRRTSARTLRPIARHVAR